MYVSTARVSEPGHTDRSVVVATSDTLDAASTELTRFTLDHTGPDHPGGRVYETRVLQLDGVRVVAHHDVPPSTG